MATATDKDPKDKAATDTAPATNPPAPEVDAESEDTTQKLDETIPGGKYIVDDNYVDAEGKFLGPVETPGAKKGAKKADK